MSDFTRQISFIYNAVLADPDNGLPHLNPSEPSSVLPYLLYFTGRAANQGGAEDFQTIFFLAFCLSQSQPEEVEGLVELARRMNHLTSVLANPEDHLPRYVREERRLAKNAGEEEESEESLRVRWESGLKASLSRWFDEFQVELEQLR